MVPVAELTFSLVSKLCTRLDVVEEALKGCRASIRTDQQEALSLQKPGATCSCLGVGTKASNTVGCGAASAGGAPGSGTTVSVASAVELCERRIVAEASAACMAALGDKTAEWQEQLMRFEFHSKDIASRVNRLEVRMQELLDGLMPVRGNASVDSFSAAASSGDTATQRHGASTDQDVASWAWPHPVLGSGHESLGGQVSRLREAVAEAQAESQSAAFAEMGDDVQKMREHALSLERQMQVLQRHMDALKLHPAPVASEGCATESWSSFDLPAQAAVPPGHVVGAAVARLHSSPAPMMTMRSNRSTSRTSHADTAVVVALADTIANAGATSAPPAANGVCRESSAAAAAGAGKGVGRRLSIPGLSGASSPGSRRQSICSITSNCAVELGSSGVAAVSGCCGSGPPSPCKASNRSAVSTSRASAGANRTFPKAVQRAPSASLVL